MNSESGQIIFFYLNLETNEEILFAKTKHPRHYPNLFSAVSEEQEIDTKIGILQIDFLRLCTKIYLFLGLVIPLHFHVVDFFEVVTFSSIQ